MIYKQNLKTKAKEVTEGRRLEHSHKSTSLGLFSYSCLNHIAGFSNRHLNPYPTKVENMVSS